MELWKKNRRFNNYISLWDIYLGSRLSRGGCISVKRPISGWSTFIRNIVIIWRVKYCSVRAQQLRTETGIQTWLLLYHSPNSCMGLGTTWHSSLFSLSKMGIAFMSRMKAARSPSSDSRTNVVYSAMAMLREQAPWTYWSGRQLIK